MTDSPELNPAWVALSVACALVIAVGLMTPIAATLAVLVQTIALHEHPGPITLQMIAPIVIVIALGLLGPGAYSIDARLFGRRLMEFGPDVDDDD